MGSRSGGRDSSVDGAASAAGGSARYAPYTPHAARQRPQPSSDGFVEELPVAPEGTDPLNVYVVDLPAGCGKDEFHALYAPFGNLVTSTVLPDPATGLSRGIGFARYSSRDNAARALKETQGLLLPQASKPLLVRFARDSSRKYDEQTQQSLHSLQTYAQQQQQQQLAAAGYAQPLYAAPAPYAAYYSQPAYAEPLQPHPAAPAQLSPFSAPSAASSASPLYSLVVVVSPIVRVPLLSRPPLLQPRPTRPGPRTTAFYYPQHLLPPPPQPNAQPQQQLQQLQPSPPPLAAPPTAPAAAAAVEQMRSGERRSGQPGDERAAASGREEAEAD